MLFSESFCGLNSTYHGLEIVIIWKIELYAEATSTRLRSVVYVYILHM